MICEGETDTMRLAQSDIPDLVNATVWCAPGATAFPSEWAAGLRRFDEVVVFADGDEAGIKLADRVASLVPGTKMLKMPEGEDVCSFLLKHDELDLLKLYQIAPVHVPPAGKIRRQNMDWDDAASRDHRDKLTRIVMLDVHLRRRGAELVGLCPFHEERTPSFSINVNKGLYRCFGCGESGDVLNYLMKKRDLSFGDALRTLKEMR